MPARAKSTRRHHFALLDQVVDHRRIAADDVGRRIGVDLLHHVALLARDHLVTARALETGREIAKAGDITLRAEHENLGRLRRWHHQRNAKQRPRRRSTYST